MKSYVVFAIVLSQGLVQGCSGDGDAEDGTAWLQGSWVAQHDTEECASAFTFKGGTYEQDLICILNDGSNAMEATVGMYVVDGSRLEFSPTHSSCPGSSSANYSVSFEQFAGDSLRMADTSGVLVLRRVEQQTTSGGTTVAFGCFDHAGVFTESKVVELK